jgi:hypothetical protein
VLSLYFCGFQRLCFVYFSSGPLLLPQEEGQSRLLRVRRPHRKRSHGDKSLGALCDSCHKTSWMNEAILDPLGPVKPPQSTPCEAGDPCLLSWDMPKWHTYGTTHNEGDCFKVIKFGGWFVTQCTAVDNHNKGFMQVLSWLKLMKLLPIQSKSKLSCQKWRLRAPHLINSLTSRQALKHLPTCVLGAHQGASCCYWELFFTMLTSYFFNFQGKMRSGGQGKETWHWGLPISRLQGDFSLCVY